MNRSKFIRWIFFIGGLLVLGLGIALTIKGKALGIGPWDVFHYGLYVHFGLTVGSWSIIMGLLIILVTWMFTKKPPKMGALLNMTLLGTFIDLFIFLLPNPSSYWMEVVLFFVGIVVIGTGIGLYVSADFGAGPRDHLMLLIHDKTGLSIKNVRNLIELVVLFLGWLLGGPVGIGSIFIALFLGFIVQKMIQQSKKWLNFLISSEILNKRVENKSA